MTLTDLDSLRVGSTCASLVTDVHGSASTFGMVVDFGVHEDGKPYVVLLSEVPQSEIRVQVYHHGAAKPKQPGVARLRRLDLDEIDPASVEEPILSRMQGWATKAILGEAVLPGEPYALVIIAGSLYQEVRRLAEAEKERRAS